LYIDQNIVEQEKLIGYLFGCLL